MPLQTNIKAGVNNPWLAASLGLLLSIASMLPVLRTLDNLWFDWLSQHYASSQSIDKDILIVEIDDKSLTDMALTVGRWPWPRSVYGYFLEGLKESDSKAIVFDILFSETDRYRPDDDQFFAETVANFENVFFAATLLNDSAPLVPVSLDSLPDGLFVARSKDNSEAKINLPWGLATDNWPTGLINFDADDDGVARHYNSSRSIGGSSLYSLPLKVVSTIRFAQKDQSVTSIKATVNDWPQQFRLKFIGKGLVPFQSISFVDALAATENADTAKALFKDKIIIIGATATGLHDLRPSPIAELYPATSILATAVDNLLHQRYWKETSAWGYFLLSLFSIFCVVLVVGKRRTYVADIAIGMGAIFVLAASGFSMSYALAYEQSVLFPVVTPLSLALVIFVWLMFRRGLAEYFSRQHALQTFSRFMDPVVVNQLLDDQNWTQKIEPQSREVSILFSDIRGFTTLSENRSAKEVMTLLNQYFDKQVETIFQHKGTLDKFIGDAIMAFWGAPLADTEHAKDAVNAALNMVDNLLEFRQTLPESLRNFDVGIGIHSGDAVVGMLGSKKRFDYTAIGDSVNLASRIEGATKGVARVLVSESTKQSCENDFNFEYRGEFQVKGRQQPVRLFEPSRKT